jgi:hypothetical protein
VEEALKKTRAHARAAEPTMMMMMMMMEDKK